MVVAVGVEMAVELIEVGDGGAVWFGEAVDGKAVEGIGDGIGGANDFLEVEGGGVVMVIVRSATMPAPIIELASQKSVFASIVEGVEDGHAINGDGDSATVEIGLGRDWIVS